MSQQKVYVFVLACSMLILQGCFGEAPSLGGLAAEGEGGSSGSGQQEEDSSSSSGASSVGEGGATSSPTLGATEAGDSEETGSSTTQADASSSSGPSSSSSGGPVDYPPCAECPGQPCIDDGAGNGACAPPCGSECPDPGWGEPACLDEIADEVAALVCVLDCTSTDACEAGMLCREIAYHAGGESLRACVWEGGGP